MMKPDLADSQRVGARIPDMPGAMDWLLLLPVLPAQRGFVMRSTVVAEKGGNR